jgi:hypothetical protein
MLVIKSSSCMVLSNHSVYMVFLDLTKALMILPSFYLLLKVYVEFR